MYRPMLLTVNTGTLSILQDDKSVLRCAIPELKVRAAGINGTLRLGTSNSAEYNVKFYERSRLLKSRSWHNQMMYQKHDNFIETLRSYGLENLPALCQKNS